MADLRERIATAAKNLSGYPVDAENLPKSAQDYAKTIDHTLLKTDVTEAQIDALCDEARSYDFASVCVRLPWVQRAVQNLQGSPVRVACVVGFHEGTQATSDKVSESANAVKAGASELDMVLNWHKLKDDQYDEVYEDIVAVRKAAPSQVALKVILETSQLSHAQIIAGCVIVEAAGAQFVKTSTGFCGQGATVDNVTLMKAVVGSRLEVKASGGIKTSKDCRAMLEAGASRIGASSGKQIVDEMKGSSSEPRADGRFVIRSISSRCADVKTFQTPSTGIKARLSTQRFSCIQGPARSWLRRSHSTIRIVAYSSTSTSPCILPNHPSSASVHFSHASAISLKSVSVEIPVSIALALTLPFLQRSAIVPPHICLSSGVE